MKMNMDTKMEMKTSAETTETMETIGKTTKEMNMKVEEKHNVLNYEQPD
jgi:hypothetical protein